MPDFSRRSDGMEIMDDLNCSGEVVHQTLRELETINELLGGNYVTIDGLSQLVDYIPTKSMTVADLGCGGGDILKLIRKWGNKKKIQLDLTGIDANPNITAFAAAHTPPSMNISYEAIDIFSDEFRKRKFDIIIGTLFFHHFTSEQLIGFFSNIKHQITTGIVVNDIHRHWFAFYSIKWLTGSFSKSSMVKFDAPLSVLRAFTRKELKEIMEKAGITDYSIRWMWAFRWQLVVRLRKPS
jgi:2-polyprenyl-3-methyl-5-hydroxy-6-metoxy-1,4-benzoquinol methylase